MNRYPAFKRIMDTYEQVEAPYEGSPSYISYTTWSSTRTATPATAGC